MPFRSPTGIRRRAFLLGSASTVLTAAVAAALPAAAQTAGDAVSLRIRSNEKIFVDLTRQLAGIHDSNEITLSVASPGGVLTAHVWLGKSLGDGQSARQVRRELLDHFVVEAKGAAPGQPAGTLTLTGYEGPQGTGVLLTRTINLVCDNAPPAVWEMGASTRAMFGGLAIHQYFPGAAADWSIKAQTRAGQFVIRRDPANNQHRLVLAGPVGLAPTIAPNPGGLAEVTLANAATGQTHTVKVAFVPLQLDIAPWPETDEPSDSISGTQLTVTLRDGMAYGNVYMLEDGVYATRRYQPGFTTGFGVTTISAAFGMPTGPYEGDTWDYKPNPTFNPKLITFRSRTPHGAYAKSLVMDLRSIRRTPNRIIGFRLSNLKLDVVNFYDGASVSPYFDIVVADHNEVTGINANSSLQLGNGRERNHKGMVAVSNWVKGNLNVCGTDMQVIGNRIEKSGEQLDAFNWAGIHSDPTNPRAAVAFNLWINNQGQDSALHADLCQLVGDAFYHDLDGPHKTARFYGNVIWGGRRRRTAEGDEAIGGQCFFFGNITGGVFQQVEFSGNIVVEISRHGNTVTRPAGGSVWRHNMFLYDHAVADPMDGSDTPILWFRGTTNDARSMIIERNIMESGGYAADQGISPPERNNVWNANLRWQTQRLVNSRLGGGARDMGDVVAALAFKPGVKLDAGPLCDPALIDHRRHTADLGRLFG